MYRYKNTSDQEKVVIGLGVVAPGMEFETKRLIENPSLKLLNPDDKSGTEPEEPAKTATDESNKEKTA